MSYGFSREEIERDQAQAATSYGAMLPRSAEDRLYWWMWKLQSGFAPASYLIENWGEQVACLPALHTGESWLAALQGMDVIRAVRPCPSFSQVVFQSLMYGDTRSFRKVLDAEHRRLLAMGEVLRVSRWPSMMYGYEPGPRFAEVFAQFGAPRQDHTGEGWCPSRETRAREVHGWVEYSCAACGASVGAGSGPHRTDREQACPCSGCTTVLDMRAKMHMPKDAEEILEWSHVVDAAAVGCVVKRVYGRRLFPLLCKRAKIAT